MSQDNVQIPTFQAFAYLVLKKLRVFWGGKNETPNTLILPTAWKEIPAGEVFTMPESFVAQINEKDFTLGDCTAYRGMRVLFCDGISELQLGFTI